jgi:hypothetical protein
LHSPGISRNLFTIEQTVASQLMVRMSKSSFKRKSVFMKSSYCHEVKCGLTIYRKVFACFLLHICTVILMFYFKFQEFLNLYNLKIRHIIRRTFQLKHSIKSSRKIVSGIHEKLYVAVTNSVLSLSKFRFKFRPSRTV